jgi:hypothetical protein
MMALVMRKMRGKVIEKIKLNFCQLAIFNSSAMACQFNFLSAWFSPLIRSN